MKAIKIENNWKTILIEKHDIIGNKNPTTTLEESLRGYLFSEILIPADLWDLFETSVIKMQLDRLLRMSMRFLPKTKYSKLEEAETFKLVEEACKSKDFRQLRL